MDSKTDQEKEFFTTAELAKFLNVSVKAVIKWRDAKRIPGACRMGRVFRFRRIDIEKRLLTGKMLLDQNGQ